MRLLNTSDLRLLATYLRQSIDLDHSFCDQAQATLESAQNKTKKFHSYSRSLYHYILSGCKYQLRDAPSVCRALNSMNIRATELFPFAQYGGSYTGSYHQADWEKDSWLTKEAQNFPLQYEVTTQSVIVRV
jgi:hypothetical protein